MLKTAEADIMLSGGRSQFIALKATMPWMDINQERHAAFAGYHGMVELVKEIDRTLSNPMWAQVRAPAPWDDAGTISWQDRAMDEAQEEPAAEPIDPRDQPVCVCKAVSAGAIADAVAAGHTSRAAVAKHTSASTGCGGCAPWVDKAVKEALAGTTPLGQVAA